MSILRQEEVMINNASLSALKKSQWTSNFKKPLYESYAFSCIPATISKLLTGKGNKTLDADAVGGSYEKYDCAILFVLDGFGWQFFEEYSPKFPLLNQFVCSKISSEFPSTTAAHITSLNTGKEVGETGIYEWFYYEPLVDRMITPLLFSNAGDHEGGTLLKEKITPQQIFPFETVYQQLAKKGVQSVVLQSEGIAHTPYSQAMLAGAKVIPFTQFSEGLEKLAELCMKPLKEPTLFYIYFGDIDGMGHRHGIHSPQFDKAIEVCWNTIDKQFWQKMAGCPNKTALMFTADHGMSPVDPKSTLYLNQLMPDITDFMKKNEKGDPLVPAGSCRDFFLHIEEKHIEEVQTTLIKHLKGTAEVVLVEELLNHGFFGSNPPSQRLKDRIGNLVVLPYLKESVWWYEKHRFEQHFFAAHGGLTPEEMESIFLFANLGKL